MYNSIAIEETLRTMALSNIKRFYIEYFANELEIDLKTAAYILHDFAMKSDKISEKFEVRCSNCIEIADEYNNLEDIDIDKYMICEDCGYEDYISKDNIYIIYYINDEWKAYIRNNEKRKKNIRRRPKITSTPSSIGILESNGVFDIKKAMPNSITINYNNYGSVGAMGDYASCKN